MIMTDKRIVRLQDKNEVNVSEDEIRCEYAKRQFEYYKAKFQLAVLRNDARIAENYLRYMEEANDTIDGLLRKIHGHERWLYDPKDHVIHLSWAGVLEW